MKNYLNLKILSVLGWITYDADKMLPFIGWSHYHKVESCREMEVLWKHNIEAVDFVLNSTKPSKSTIGTFLKDYENLIQSFDEFIKKFSVNRTN